MPKKRPNDPPNSARKDVKGYKNASSFKVKLLVENRKANPMPPELS